MKIKFLLGVAIASVLTFPSCELVDATETLEREFNVSAFNEVYLGDAMRIEIKRGNTFQVRARGAARDVNDLQMRVVNGRLTAKYEPSRNNRKRTEIVIQMPSLQVLHLSGATKTRLYGFEAETEHLDLQVSGASELDALLAWKSAEISISGASEVALQGVTPIVDAEVSGASKLNAGNWRTSKMRIQLSGVSQARVNALNELTGSVSGNSELGYIGNPAVLQVNTSDNSRLRKL